MNNKQVIRLTESDLHRIIKESVNKVLKEVSLKGKSGKEYSFHGDNYDSWNTLAKLRKQQMNTPNRIMTGREKDAYNRDEDNGLSLMSDYLFNTNQRGERAVDRLLRIADETSDYISKDIMANNESQKLHRIIKESVNKVVNEVSLKGKSGKVDNVLNTSDESPYSDVIVYGDNYGLKELGRALYEIAKNREVELTTEFGDAIWRHDKNNI